MSDDFEEERQKHIMGVVLGSEVGEESDEPEFNDDSDYNENYEFTVNYQKARRLMIDRIKKVLARLDCKNIKERKVDYGSLRSWYLFGNGPDEAPALYNKIYPHIDQLTSFLYSAETTRFSIDVGAAVDPREQVKVPALTRALNDEWLNSNADQVFSAATTWSLVYNYTLS